MDLLHLTIQPHLIAMQLSNAAVNQKLCSFAPICGKLSLSVFPCHKSDFWRGQLEYLEVNFILFSLLLPPMICRDMMLPFYLFFLIEYLLHCNEKRNLLFSLSSIFLQREKADLASSITVLKRFQEKLRQKDCCPLCHRDFITKDEVSLLIEEVSFFLKYCVKLTSFVNALWKPSPGFCIDATC